MAHDTSTLPVVADALALALVASSDAPIVLLDGDLMVVAASASFARAFQIDPAAASARSLFSLGERGVGRAATALAAAGDALRRR